MNLSTARIFVHDLAQAQHFYGAVLGLPLHAGGADHGFCVFAPGNMQLVVEPVDAGAPEEDRVLVGRFTGLSFTVASVQEKYTELQARGVPFTEAPQVQPWGGVLATFSDPAGNRLQLVQLPG